MHITQRLGLVSASQASALVAKCKAISATLHGLIVASTALVGDMAMRAAEGWQVRVPIAALPSSQAIVVLSGMLVAPPGDVPLGE